MIGMFMKKQKMDKNTKFKNLGHKALLVVLCFVMSGSFIASSIVRADEFDEKINRLEAQNNNKEQRVGVLSVEATSLQDKINKLGAQIDRLQSQIKANQVKSANLKKQIVKAQKELERQKELLGDNIRAMYVEGEISTLEMLASSKDLSEFLDKQQYRTAVQEKIKVTLDKITSLKLKLKSQRERLEKMIADQKSMRDQLASQQAEQDRLLNLNASQRSALNAQIRNNNSQIQELRRQQIIANARFMGGAPGSGPTCGGGYPARWCQVPQDSVVDSWGMFNRECVSYAAFKVAASGRHMPYWGGIGNANQWDDNARNAGIRVDGNPRVGDVAQTDAGFYGHVMYVEHVYGDGTIYVSQYNAGLDGRYSEKRISAAGLSFIHF